MGLRHQKLMKAGSAGEKRKNSIRFTFVQIGFARGQVSDLPTG
jgi:hypothetical protein